MSSPLVCMTSHEIELKKSRHGLAKHKGKAFQLGEVTRVDT